MKKILIRMVSALGVSLLLWGIWFTAEERSTLYRYDVTADYSYRFNRTVTSIHHLNLQNGEMVLPVLDRGSHTVFVEVVLDSTLFGSIFQPKIVLKTRHAESTQFIEHGAEGIRYINISHLIEGGITRIHLLGRNVAIEDQKIKLVVFKAEGIDNRKMLVLSPHPDDAEIAAYGLYSSGKNAYIVTITAGDAGHRPLEAVTGDAADFYARKGKIRVWNSITTPLLAGIPIEQTVNLGYFDGMLTAMYADKNRAVTSKYAALRDIAVFREMNASSIIDEENASPTWHSLVSDLMRLLVKIQPDIIVTPLPALDSHPDHKLTTLALFEAITSLNFKTGRLYFYTNHHVLSAAYPFGKAGSLVSLPPNFDDRLIVGRVYSHGLTLGRQREKLIALETMNDLRTDVEQRTVYGAVKLALKRIKNELTGWNLSYFRRAVRPNELFFVINIKDIYNADLRRRLQ